MFYTYARLSNIVGVCKCKRKKAFTYNTYLYHVDDFVYSHIELFLFEFGSINYLTVCAVLLCLSPSH